MRAFMCKRICLHVLVFRVMEVLCMCVYAYVPLALIESAAFARPFKNSVLRFVEPVYVRYMYHTYSTYDDDTLKMCINRPKCVCEY